MSVSKEDRIKAEAYSRWEREGRPNGAHERHWLEAAEVVGMPEGASELESEGTTNASEMQLSVVDKPKRMRAKKMAAE